MLCNLSPSFQLSVKPTYFQHASSTYWWFPSVNSCSFVTKEPSLKMQNCGIDVKIGWNERKFSLVFDGFHDFLLFDTMYNGLN